MKSPVPPNEVDRLDTADSVLSRADAAMYEARRDRAARTAGRVTVTPGPGLPDLEPSATP